MKRKRFLIGGVILLILLVAAIAVRLLYVGSWIIGSSEGAAYQFQYRQIGKKMLLQLERDTDAELHWNLMLTDPDSAVKELRENRQYSQYLVNAGDAMYVTAEFLLKTAEDNSRCRLQLEIVKDGDGKLFLLNPREILLEGIVSETDSEVLPYTCIGQEDGSLRIYFDMDAEGDWDWAYAADPDLTVAGPEYSDKGFLFYIRPNKTGEYSAEIGLIGSYALHLTIQVKESEETHQLAASVIGNEIGACTLENTFLSAERTDFEKIFGTVHLLEQDTALKYEIKHWRVSEDKPEGYEGGEIRYKAEQLPDGQWTLCLSDEASLHGFQEEFESWYTQYEDAQWGNQTVTIYRDENYLAAVWSKNSRAFSLECHSNAEDIEQIFLNELASIIEAN